MNIIYHSLYKIDIATQEVTLQQFAEKDNVNNYIIELLENVSNNEGDREYVFEENSLTMKTYLNEFIIGNDRDLISESIAKRLLQEENTAQTKIDHLKIKIQKGMLIVSFVQMIENEYKIILSKADYNEFIEEITGVITNGLPTKKKIFKSFIANVKIDDDETEMYKLLTYDSNTTKAAYWWKEFLELVEIRDDDKNTLTAYNSIKRDILEPIKKNHKSDYLHLWNATIAYFRGEGDFDLNHFRDNIIGNYQPNDNTLDMAKVKEKINKLPTKYKFDSTFVKKPKIVKDKFKNTISLSKEIDLVIKHDVANPKKTFVPFEKDGNLYLGILSPEGYQFAGKIEGNE